MDWASAVPEIWTFLDVLLFVQNNPQCLYVPNIQINWPKLQVFTTKIHHKSAFFVKILIYLCFTNGWKLFWKATNKLNFGQVTDLGRFWPNLRFNVF